MKPETKYKGAIKLAAIGDALGWITEFESQNTGQFIFLSFMIGKRMLVASSMDT